jgi:hypothetical protein
MRRRNGAAERWNPARILHKLDRHGVVIAYRDL